jgi:hypothetical protein
MRGKFELKPDTQHVLEELVDSTSVMHVLEALANICHLKSEHLRSTWQDELMAIAYERTGNRILALHVKLHSYFDK